jgi:hypothetical protein
MSKSKAELIEYFGQQQEKKTEFSIKNLSLYKEWVLSVKEMLRMLKR